MSVDGLGGRSVEAKLAQEGARQGADRIRAVRLGVSRGAVVFGLGGAEEAELWRGELLEASVGGDGGLFISRRGRWWSGAAEDGAAVELLPSLISLEGPGLGCRGRGGLARRLSICIKGAQIDRDAALGAVHRGVVWRAGAKSHPEAGCAPLALKDMSHKLGFDGIRSSGRGGAGCGEYSRDWRRRKFSSLQLASPQGGRWFFVVCVWVCVLFEWRER